TPFGRPDQVGGGPDLLPRSRRRGFGRRGQGRRWRAAGRGNPFPAAPLASSAGGRATCAAARGRARRAIITRSHPCRKAVPAFGRRRAKGEEQRAKGRTRCPLLLSERSERVLCALLPAGRRLTLAAAPSYNSAARRRRCLLPHLIRPPPPPPGRMTLEKIAVI